MSIRRNFLFIFSAIFLTPVIFSPVIGQPIEDREALIDFFNNMTHSRLLNWDVSTSPCRNWTGVYCNVNESRVIAVRLPGFGFHGPIPTNTLSRLSELQILSFRSNDITGPFPSDFSKLKNLNGLYLQHNKFSGPLPSDFSVWKNLTVIDLSNNAFNGSIPSSILNLTHLTALNLANNSLSGEIPDLDIPSLQHLDLSTNNLSGRVPKSLQRFPSWVFSGNNLTPEIALPPAYPILPPNSQPSNKGKGISNAALLGILIGGLALIFSAVAVIMAVCWSAGGKTNKTPSKAKKKEISVKNRTPEIQNKDGTLKFLNDCSFSFDLEDLLRASAEVLGKGTFGTTYKAALDDGTTVVVKRLKEVSVTKKEFEQNMEVFGSIKHENVAALKAFYYSKDEKLVVYDYYGQGSVSAMLHGKREDGGTLIDWDTRLRVAIGAARGIAHIHSEKDGKLVHGNIKASNTFLNVKGFGCVSDAGMSTLMNPLPAPASRMMGYRSPELTDVRKASQPSDVYSFGVLVLELLTGKSPVHARGGEEIVHLVRWVNSVVREEWTAEVFDVELLKYSNIEEEMVAMLQIGLSCVAKMPEQRPKMADVLAKIEQVRQLNGDLSKSEDSTPSRRVFEIGSASNYR